MPTLKWLTRDEDLKSAGRAAYRLLYEIPEFGAGDKNTENMIIQGDNLEGLKALLPFYAGQIKCIYIDPPYNTGSRINSDGEEVGYDDNLEHSIWLSMMYPRLEVLHALLAEDGSIWISIDEKESHYLKVICDEIFGRRNFVIQTTIQRGAVSGHKAINPTPIQITDLMLTYAKNKEEWKYKPVFLKRGYDKAYSLYIENMGEDLSKWKFVSLKEALKAQKITLEECVKRSPERIIRFAQPNYAAVGQSIRDLIDVSKTDDSKVYKLKRENHSDVYLYKGNRILFYKDKLKLIDGVYTTAELATNLWLDMNYQGISSEGDVTFLKGKKPETQIKRIFEMSTQSGDLVLDSFLGSGTTVAVAHKMGRRYIGIEMGKQAKSHCAFRLNKVIEGDQSGISKSVGWTGGGGFRFYTLGDTIFDEDGQIREMIRFDQLAAHLWFYETKTPFNRPQINSTFLGTHNDKAYALLYNGVLHDKSVGGGNVLTSRTLEVIRKDIGDTPYDKLIVYGESSRIGLARLKTLGIEFKQTPYDVRAK